MSRAYNKIVIGITGTIGALNVHNYIFALKGRFQCQLDIVVTDNAKQFVSTLALANLCDHIYDDLFTANLKAPHVNAVQDADLFLILPASADFLAKMAHGMADDLLSCCVLNYTNQIYIAPNMNNTMWNQPSVQRNVEILKKDGHLFVNVQAEGYKASSGTYTGSDAALPQPEELIQLILHEESRMNEPAYEYNN